MTQTSWVPVLNSCGNVFWGGGGGDIPPRVTCDLCCNGFKGHQDEIDLRGGKIGILYVQHNTHIYTLMLHSIVLCCIVLHSIVLCCVVLCCILLLCCIVLCLLHCVCCFVLHCIACKR